MKLKTIIITGIVVLTIFVIYLTTLDRKVYYLDLDVNHYNYGLKIKNYIQEKNKLEKFVNGYTNDNDRTTDLINAINFNKKIVYQGKKQTIKNALIKADLVTITTGINDINYKIDYDIDELYDQVDQTIVDIEKLLKLLKNYCKEDIIFIGIINIYGSEYNELFEYMNNKLGEICYQQKIYFIHPTEYYNDITMITNQMNKIIKKKVTH